MNNQNKELIVANEKALAEFELTPAKVSQMAAEYMHLTVPEGDKDAYKIARAALTICVKARTGTDARRKDLGSEAREWLADVAEAARALVEPLIPVESHLKAEVYNEDTRLKEKKAEKARKEFERVEEIREKIKGILGLNAFMNQQTTSEDMHAALTNAEAIEITEEEYMEFAFEAQKTKETVCAELVKAIEIRDAFESEEAAKEAEEKRKADARKAEEERLATERAEIDRLKAEQDERQKAIDEEQEKVDAEKNRLELQEIERQANVKAAAEAEAITKKAQEDAKAKLEQEAREKEGREKAEAKAEAEKDERRPDKEKLDRWLDQMALVLFDHPEEGLKNFEAQKAFNVIYERLDGALKYSKNLIENL